MVQQLSGFGLLLEKSCQFHFILVTNRLRLARKQIA